VPLEIGRQFAQPQEIGPIEGARLRPRGIQKRCGMPFREHEPIAARMLRVGRIEPHFGEKDGSDEVRRRTAACRMAAAGL
jgi:hypothetical protein